MAYEAGHYRDIQTNGKWLTVSPDKVYLYAHEDGIYRLGDGALIAPFDNAVFSPDGRYVVQLGDGIYCLPALKRIIPTNYENIAINHYVDDSLEHRTWAILGDVQFSDNGEYVAVTGDGVYRLIDQQKIVDTSAQEITDSKSLEVEFNADSSAASTIDGIFQLSDGKLLFQTGDYFARFSPDGSYALTRLGIIRLSDGEMFDIVGDISFTPDMQYAVLPGDGVYRLSDGQRLYDLPQFATAFARSVYSPDNQYMAVSSNGLYRIRDGRKLSESSNVVFSPDSLHVAIGSDGIYRLSDMRKLLDLTAYIDSSSHFSGDGAYLAVSDAIIHIVNGKKLFNKGSSATFSPNNEYVAFNDDGVYRLSDQHKLFAINGGVHGFSPDSAYVSVYDRNNWMLYRIRDGRSYPNLRFLDVSAGIMADGNTVLIVGPNHP
ncbi:MAG: hypothetical protein CL610_27190 [Anaerolineaceae bacterium]|nr:hypothetical protein [Anaerolineaceae bacterium]